jgi:iron only hydrogenase large subunit-like protein
MTTSCCPAFVNYMHKKFPDQTHNISSTVSPMIAISQIIKRMDENAKVVFIGPCIAKKGEKNLNSVKGVTDYVITFEELAAIIDAKQINFEKIQANPLNNSTEKGRGFAASGGVANAISNYIKLKELDLEFKPILCSGIKEAKKVLTMAKLGKLQGNFIEGMACNGGCIKGPVTMHYGNKDKKSLENYSKLAKEKDPVSATEIFNTENIMRYNPL